MTVDPLQSISNPLKFGQWHGYLPRGVRHFYPSRFRAETLTPSTRRVDSGRLRVANFICAGNIVEFFGWRRPPKTGPRATP